MSVYRRIQRRTFQIIDRGEEGDLPSKIVDLFIMALIVLNVGAVIIETEAEFVAHHKVTLHTFDIFSVAVFTIEYLLRIWSCTSERRFAHPVMGRLRFMVRPMALVDLAAIAPFFLPMLLTMDMRAVRALRLFRLFRLFKMGRYCSAMQTMGRVLLAKKEEMLVGLMIMLMLLVFAASAMYFVEHDAQPEAFGSIPKAMWWSAVTLTTVGYGDVTPVTALGKVLAACMAMLGVGMFALPAAILAQGFVQEVDRRKKSAGQPRCPNCGAPVGRRASDAKPVVYARAS